MEEVVRKTVSNAFETLVDDLINDDKQIHQFEWDNNPFHAIDMINRAIHATKNKYKELLKENNKKFGIEIYQVDDFVESLTTKMRNKYFE